MNGYQNYIDLRTLLKLGQTCFYLGTFFLASALPIAAIFYLIAIFISFWISRFLEFKNKWNLSLLAISILFLISFLKFYFFDQDLRLSFFDKSLTIASLFNWFPLFIIFIYFQKYLKTLKQREIFAKFLISGTIPVLISCILQYWFQFYGPQQTLGGLIIWFNKPLGPQDGVSGLFSNANYTGFWLSATFPMLLHLINRYKFFSFKKFILLLISSITIYFVIFTNSRNSILSLLTSILFIFGMNKIILIFSIILISFLLLNLFTHYFQILNINFVDNDILRNLSEKFSIKNNSPKSFPRIKIWSNTLKLIYEKPFFGYGAATFPVIYFVFTSDTHQHAHNILLQVSYEQGILNAIAITTFISLLFYKCYLKIKKTEDKLPSFLLNKCWLGSLLITMFHHLNDLTYYDGKINILIWILITGTKCIIEDNSENSENYN